MSYGSGHPFDSIESAHEFLALLSEVVVTTRTEIHADLARESDATDVRRVDALRLAAYHLHNLEHHMVRSRRILNDLRCIRRLLFAERGKGAAKPNGPGPAATPKHRAAAA
jgi:hypothetical protein